MSYELDAIQGSIMDRQRELHDVATLLAQAAQKLSRWSNIAKVLLIFLGALAATQGAMSQFVSTPSTARTAMLISYTIVGLLVAVIAGLEAAFKSENRAAELTVLAASCHSTVRIVDSQWQKEIGTVDEDQRLPAMRKLLDLQDTKLQEIQEKAARLGVNITLEVRNLRNMEERYAA